MTQLQETTRRLLAVFVGHLGSVVGTDGVAENGAGSPVTHWNPRLFSFAWLATMCLWTTRQMDRKSDKGRMARGKMSIDCHLSSAMENDSARC